MAIKQGFHISEKCPDGLYSFKYVFKRFDDNIKSSEDLRDIWNVIIPDMRKSLKYEFSQANPNDWKSLKASTLKSKARRGSPLTIGIDSGLLKKSLTDSAIINKARKVLTWASNPNISNRGRKVGDYGQFFNLERPIFQYTKKFINDILKKAALQSIKKGKTGEGW